MRIGIIGLGEVGRCYARLLHSAGITLSVCESRPSSAALEMAETWGLVLNSAPDKWLADCDWTLSCVTGAQALAVTTQAAPFMKAGSGLADLTTASPSVKRQASAVADQAGIRYVDTAIMGAISLNWGRTALLAAGNGAEELAALLRDAGGRVEVIEGGLAGDAISLKILRSVFTKGMEALAVELLMSAERQGVRDKLFAQLNDIDQTPLRSFVEMLVRTHVIHAKRRAHEVHDAQGELTAQGIASDVLPGVERRFLATAAQLEARPLATSDPTVDQALEWLLATTPQD